MGREIRCMAELRTWSGDGRLLLETDDLVFRGAQRLSIPLKSITAVTDDNGWLVVEHAGERSRFDLGRLTPSWVNAIANPRTRIDRLEVKPDARIALDGEFEEDFVREIEGRTNPVDITEAGDACDLVFLRVDTLSDLGRLPALRARIRPGGGIWVVHPKGDAALKHEPIVDAAREAGLIDTKTARYSDTHTALKLVIPRDQR